MLPAGCVEWHYENSPDYKHKLAIANAALLTRIYAGSTSIDIEGRDPRLIHTALFTGLTPAGQEYYVGNYRGGHKRCLRNYEVQIKSDRRVGVAAATVASNMHRFGETLVATITALDEAIVKAGTLLDPAYRAVQVVQIACEAFVQFLTIHPFADGNGHTARAILWIILARFSYLPHQWTIDPRPLFPEYAQLIKSYRDGDRSPLLSHILNSLVVKP